MRSKRYLLCTSLVLLLASGLGSASGLQEAPASEPTTPTPGQPEQPTSESEDATTASSTATSATVPVTTSKPASSTQAASTTKKPTVKPTTTTTSKPVANCPQNCTCPNERELNCEGLDFKQLPTFEFKSTFVRLRFARNKIETLDLNKQRNFERLEMIDLSGNQLKRIALPKKPYAANLAALTRLDLSNNSLESIYNLSSWSMVNLEYLDVSRNPLKQLQLGPPETRPRLTHLIANDLRLKEIDEQAFVAAQSLTFLNLSRAVKEVGEFLEDSVFATNTQLDTLDLSHMHLLEVPVALRSVTSLKRLILNGNLMTSLRLADLLHLKELVHLEIRNCPALQRVDGQALASPANLKTVIISDNPRFNYFSPEAFSPVQFGANKNNEPPFKRRVQLLDLSFNNITSLAPWDTKLVTIDQIHLAGNPLDCRCELEWLVKMPNLYQQQPIHCATPAKFRDLELSQFFDMHDCAYEDSLFQRWVVTFCILFLLLVTVAVFVQKTDLCRRLRWRDQYGTIYYTKASFPQEQL